MMCENWLAAMQESRCTCHLQSICADTSSEERQWSGDIQVMPRFSQPDDCSQ
jgi:hypothetical protein